MAKWNYEGLDKNGKKIAGIIDVKTEKEARKQLRAQGVRVKSLQPPGILEFDFNEWMVEKGYAASYGPKELVMFTRQLNIMLSAGVPILQTLEIMHKQERNPSLKIAVRNIATAVSEGKTFAEALGKEKGFDKLYVSLVRAGEAGGILDKILEKLSEHLERSEATKSQVKKALSYPGFVFVIGMGVVCGLMIFVVPQFMGMVKDSGQEPPFVTVVVVTISEVMQQWWYLIIGGLVGGIFFFLNFIKSKEGKPIFDAFFMKVPVFGLVVIKAHLANFSRTLGTLLESGVSLIDAIDLCTEIIDHNIIVNDLKKVRKALVEGKTLTEPLAKIDYFPPMVTQMIKVGEQTGNLGAMLSKIASIFDEEVKSLIEAGTKMIEPAIIVILGGIIAFVMVAMYLPIFMSAGGAG